MLKYVGEDHPIPTNSGRDLASFIPGKKFYFPINKQKALSSGWVDQNKANRIVDRIDFDFGKGQWITKMTWLYWIF